jgi:hypothetical protein
MELAGDNWSAITPSIECLWSVAESPIGTTETGERLLATLALSQGDPHQHKQLLQSCRILQHLSSTFSGDSDGILSGEVGVYSSYWNLNNNKSIRWLKWPSTGVVSYAYTCTWLFDGLSWPREAWPLPSLHCQLHVSSRTHGWSRYILF